MSVEEFSWLFSNVYFYVEGDYLIQCWLMQVSLYLLLTIIFLLLIMAVFLRCFLEFDGHGGT